MVLSVCVTGRENRQLGEDQRSLGNMGYLERGGLPHGVPMDDMPCGTGLYSLWKPPYFPRGEAPPPYEEAVAAARAELALLSMNPHPLLPMNYSDSYIPNTNNHTSVAVVANARSELTVNTQASSNDSHVSTPLISASNRPLSSPGTFATGSYRPVSQSGATSTIGLNTNTSTTSFTMGTNTYENLPVPAMSFNNSQHSGVTSASAQPLLPMSHSTIPKSYRQQTSTLPLQNGNSGGGAFTISATLSNSDVCSHRTVPRTLTTRVISKAMDVLTDCSAKDYLCLSPSNITAMPHSLSHSVQQSAALASPSNYKSIKESDAFYTDAPVASASGLMQSETYTANAADASEKPREFKVCQKTIKNKFVGNTYMCDDLAKYNNLHYL